jgi:hypothetical protein
MFWVSPLRVLEACVAMLDFVNFWFSDLQTDSLCSANSDDVNDDNGEQYF